MVSWRNSLEDAWPALRFGETRITSDNQRHLFEMEVYTGKLDPDAVRVELYAEGVDGGAPAAVELTRLPQERGAGNVYVYSTHVSAARPATDYTARLIPHCPGVAVPLEATRILWQR
jgi:starch phosphorylase